MARVAVTFEQVAAVANVLYAQGIKDPGTKAIREELAKRAGPGSPTGSPNTIQAHLNRWRAENRPVDAAEVPRLPAQLAADIARALTAAAAVAREKVEERLARVQAEFDELLSAGQANEARIEELTQELAERTAETAEVRASLASTSEKAATLERELHAAQADAQAANGRVDEIRQATERQLAKMQAELDQERVGLAEAQLGRVEAEKRAVAAEAHLEGERAARAHLEAQCRELQGDVKRLEGEAARAASAEASAVGLREQLALLNNTVDMLRGMLRSSNVDLPPSR